MKTKSEAIGDTTPEEPTIKALPTPTEADGLRDQLATLVAANSDLAEKLGDATTALQGVRELQERTSHTLAQTQAQLAEANAQITGLNNAIREVNAALEQKNSELETLRTERDEAVAMWEEWNKHPFFSAVWQLAMQTDSVNDQRPASAQEKTVMEELADDWRELVAAVNKTGKGGTVTLALGMKPLEGQHAAMVVGSKVAKKLPKGDPATAIVFVDQNGTMTADDPNQKRLPLSGDKKRKPKVTPAAELAKAKAAKVVEIPEGITEDGPELSDDEEEIYDAAAPIAAQEKVTAAILQRRLRIPYVTAARIFTALKERQALSE
jgi:hypothetical protein